MNTASKGPAYNRQLLLDGAKRNTVLDLTEVVEVDEWVKLAQAHTGEGAADPEAFTLEPARGGGDRANGPRRGVAWVGDGHPWQGEGGGCSDGWHVEVYN